jgi:hypothetical protein
MRTKLLLISSAVLAAAMMTAACEKTPNGETKQSGCATTEAGQQGKSQRTEAQKSPDQPGQIPSRGTGQDQEKKSSEAAREGTEQQTERADSSRQEMQQKPAETARVGNEQASEPGHEKSATTGEDRSRENARAIEPSQQNRNTVETNGGAPERSPTQPNQSQQKEAQQQNQRATGTVNSNPEHGSAASGRVNLSRDEIRHLQMVLNQKGFHIGKADGILGARTRNVLIAFQRQQGLEPTGGIDQRTMIALGISNSAASRTSGQGGSGTQ